MKHLKDPLRIIITSSLALLFATQAVAAPQEVEDLFAPGVPVGESGFDSEWFGLIEESALPWILHEHLGWIYMDSGDWIHQAELGWTWISTDSPGYLFRHDTQGWQLTDSSAADGWYYDYIMRDYWNVEVIPTPFTVLVCERLWQADEKLRTVIPTVPSVIEYPINTVAGGDWTNRNSSAWTSGFWPGILWHLYDFTGDPYWETQARAWNAGMESQKNNTGTHDVGFMMYCSFGQGYRLTGDSDFRDILVKSAESLNSRYSATVGGIRSWSWGKWDDGNNFTIIADNMMNLELEFWASRQPGGEQSWADNALQHAKTTYREHVREDGGSYHCIIFHQNTGAVLERTTHQGYGDETTWGRGQAWLVHGFTTTYRETGDPTILEAAQRTADFVLENIPDTYVNIWDYDVPFPQTQPRDSSATSIAASGIIELAMLSSDPARKEKYWNGAIKMLEALLADDYFNDDTQALIDHGTYNKPAGNYDSGLVWGDYYLMEAMLRYLVAVGQH